MYYKFSEKWQKYRDVVAGEDEVKAHGEIYLPKPSGMDADDYKNYKVRAQFFNATGRTLEGLYGMLCRKPIFYTIPKEYQQYLNNIDGKGHNLQQFTQDNLKDILTINWGGFLNDMPNTRNAVSQLEYEQNGLYPYSTFYKAEDIINWHWETIGRQQRLKFVILQEKSEVIKEDYHIDIKMLYRVCEIDETGYYKQTLYDETFQKIGETYPEDKNGKFRTIPFWFVFGTEPTESILSDLISTNLSHYWKCADLNNGGHWTGVPTPYVVGAEPETITNKDGEEVAVPMRLGGTEVKYLPIGGSMHYLEFSGQGCNLLRSMLADDEDRMAILGARIISNEKKGVEAAETAKIHRAGENSVLATFANRLSNTLSQVVKQYLEWCSGNEIKQEDVEVRINTDYDVSTMTSQELTSLVSAWQSGGISKRILFENLKEGEIIDATTSFEDMQTEIEDEKLKSFENGQADINNDKG